MKKVVTAVLFIWFCSFQNALAQTTLHAQLGLGVAQTQDMATFLSQGENILGPQVNIGLNSKSKFSKFYVPGAVKFQYSTYSPSIMDIRRPVKPSGQPDPFLTDQVTYSFLHIQSGIGTTLAEKLNIELLVGIGLLMHQQPEDYSKYFFQSGKWNRDYNLSVSSRIGYQFGPKFGIYTELNRLNEMRETSGYNRSQTSYSLGVDFTLLTIKKKPEFKKLIIPEF
jgi:hypothetical protein